MTDKLKISKPIAWAIASIILILIIGLIWFFAIKPDEATTAPSVADSSSVIEQTVQPEIDVESLRYTESELRAMVEQVAKEQFGDDAFILFLSPEGPSKLEINGTERNIYIYAADSKSAHDETGTIRGLYHVDADTGEIFDNGSGNMEKIKSGE